MLTQTKDAPTRLAFQTQASRRRSPSVVLLIVVLLAIGSTTWGGGTERGHTDTIDLAKVAVRGRASCRSRSSASCSWRR